MHIKGRNRIMNLDNKNIGILGLGVSGYSAAKLASSLGANVFVSDSKSDVNDSYMKELTNMGVDIELGLHSEKILNSDLIIKVKEPIDTNIETKITGKQKL